MSEWMLRLIQSDPSAAGQSDLRHASPTGLVEWALEGHPSSFQLLGGRFDVLTQQVELVVVLLFGRMESDLSGRQREDQPAASRIHGVETEHVSEECAVGRGISAVDEYVRARDEWLHPVSLSRVMTGPVLAWTDVRAAGR